MSNMKLLKRNLRNSFPLLLLLSLPFLGLIITCSVGLTLPNTKESVNALLVCLILGCIGEIITIYVLVIRNINNTHNKHVDYKEIK